jgi:hypothetical protein
MRSPRLVPVFMSACLAVVASCSDSRTSTTPVTPDPVIPRQTLLVTLTGVIHAADPLFGVRLATDAEDIPLRGTETASLMALADDEVEVHGTWDANVFLVHDFIVRQVGGVDVLDGIFTTMYDDETSTLPMGYGIYTTSGSLVPLVDPPQDLIDHLGDRIWVTASADGKPEAYGIIGPPTTWAANRSRR